MHGSAERYERGWNAHAKLCALRLDSRRLLAVVVLVVATGCSTQRHDVSVDRITLLTRGGCTNSLTMRRHLDEALTAIGTPSTYEVIDLDGLPEADLRRGYPTPTVLYAGRDLFGMPEPKPPLPAPT